LKFLTWNVNGLISKFSDPDFFAYLKKFSFICLCETFVSFVDCSESMKDYVSFIAPAKRLSKQGRLSGGVLCLIKREMLEYFEYIGCKYDNVLVFKISRTLFDVERDILLFCTYVPPISSPFYDSSDIANGIDAIERCILDIMDLHGNCAIMLCGDLNARTGLLNTVCRSDVDDLNTDVMEESRESSDKVTNEFGNHLISACIALDLTILNGCLTSDRSGGFTYVSHTGSSVIDYWIVSDDVLSCCQALAVEHSVVSPHMCLELCLRATKGCKGVHTPEVQTTKIVWNPDLRDIYIENLCELMVEFNTDGFLRGNTVDINFATENVTFCIVHAADFLKKTYVNRAKNYSSQWYDGECYLAKNAATKHLRKFMKTHSSDDRKAYTEYRNNYKNLIRKKKRQYAQTKTSVIIENLSNAKTFWRLIRSLNAKPFVVPNISKDEWVQHFKLIFSNVCELQLYDDSSPAITPELDITYVETEITMDEIVNAIQNLKNGKAPGTDNILGEMLKCSSNYITPYLCKLFNHIFTSGKFPKSWSRSVMVPLHKGGPLDDPDNFRGISLTSILSKVFLHIINSRLQTWVDDNNLIGEEQAGFRRGYSTIDNIFVLSGLIQKYLNRRRKLYMMFVDYRKAFDTVSRQAVHAALEMCGVSGKIGKLIKSMYESVHCCVKCPDGNTEYFKCMNGLKQGCKTSPLIFSMIMSMISKEIIKKGKHGVQIMANGSELFTLLFADDLVLLSDTVLGLQNQINNLKEASDRFGLSINRRKTKVVVFRRGGYLAAHERWFLGDERLEIVNQYRYLGIILSTKLCTNTLLSELICRGKAAMLQILRSLKKLTFISPDVLFKVFDSQIQPILLYGAEVWGVDDCECIEAVHTSMLKRYVNVSARTPNTMLYGDTGRFPIVINAAVRSVKYWLRLLRMEEDRYPLQVYQMMLKSMKKQRNWAFNMKDLLTKYGFGNVWENQRIDNESIFVKNLRERMIYDFHMKWQTDLLGSDRYTFYRLVKPVCELDQYLFALDKKIFRDHYVRFRFGISDLYIHRNRYNKASYRTVCPICMEEEEDEVHFLLSCPALYDLRLRFIMPHVPLDGNDPVTSIFRSRDVHVIRSVSAFIYYAFRRRTEAVNDHQEDFTVNA